MYASDTRLDSLVSRDEILEVAREIYKAGMLLLVIDTENKFVSTGFAKEIARVAQGVSPLCKLVLFYFFEEKKEKPKGPSA